MTDGDAFSQTTGGTGYPLRFIPRFTLSTLLLATVIVAMAFGFLIQQRRHAATQAALSRYESAQIPTSLQVGQFRVIARSLVDFSHVKIMSYRIETAEECNISMEGDGAYSSAPMNYDRDTDLYWSEVVILIDHQSRPDRVKIVVSGTGSGGYSQFHVRDDYSLEKAVKFREVNGVLPLDKPVVLFEWDGKPYSLSFE